MKTVKGLTSIEVKERIKKGQVNYDTTTPSKSIKEIIIENTCTLFNFINIILGVAIIIVGSYKNLLFLGVVVCNTLISTIQEIRAKKILDKLSVISSTKAKVIRDGVNSLIKIDEIVLDDVIKYELGDQIIVDSKIIEGILEVNEAFITGEAKTITKKEGDTLLSGSFVVSGNATCNVIHVGIDNYTSLISRDAKVIKKEVNSEIMKTLNKIVKYVSICLIPIGLLLLLRQFNIPGNTTENAVVRAVAAVVGMIPEGLILLVSTVLAISVLRLSKVNVLVQDLYSIETLARVDTLCLDKTGTITEGVMEVYDVVPLNNHNMSDIEIIMEAVSTNLDDKTPTFKAINEKYGNDSNLKAKKIEPFSSEKKYSKIIFKDYSYIMGALEYIISDEKLKKEADKLSEENRVLLLAKEENNNIEPLAFILLKDKLRKNVCDTLNYFMDNDVELKVISGDNPKTVAMIAKSVGINVKGIYDATNLSEETNLNLIVEENNIFGRVKPNDKRLLISALKNNGHVVAMTGDGVNDVLALKEADCAIAMNDGADAARNVSEMVLLDSDFNSIPNIVKEGRRTINNVERSATLFLSKTIYASLLALLFLFINYSYPFKPIGMTLINALTIGIPAFILALEPNFNRVKDKFFINVISKAIPSGVTTVINILLLVLLAKLFNFPSGQTETFAVVITAYTAFLLIYRISKPLNYLRKMLLFTLSLVFILVLITSAGRKIFSLELLKPNSILLLMPLMYISVKMFWFITKILNKVIEKKSGWFK